ncbi:hypothetical protein [Leptospira licerasiae]|uniref:hypothetical protein n=1 Tax=Leptospira licerasiae TaxID=447106 RepID=UPI0014383DC2|nr:hypothetical protein [Leptospira licerasiae]
MLRNLRLASGTFRFVTRFAEQNSRQVLTHSRNVAKPWSLDAIAQKLIVGLVLVAKLQNIIKKINNELDNLKIPSYRNKLDLDINNDQIKLAKRFVNELHENSDENQIRGFFRGILDYQLSPKMHELLDQLNDYYDSSKKGIVSRLISKLFQS